MATLLATNILLAIIVLCIVVLCVLMAITLYHVIGTVRRVKRIVKEFDDDIQRTRSVLISIKDLIVEKIFGKSKTKTH